MGNVTAGMSLITSIVWLDILLGVSTSGPPFKAPGRVGDSPLPGCGLYADNTVMCVEL